MQVDPSTFRALNVIDSCAVWNLLSSRLLYSRALTARCNFCCTNFVEYECLYKRRSVPSAGDQELRQRMLREQQRGQFQSYSIEIEDLQQIERMQTQRRLSYGELSSIAFAKRTQQAFLTDDQKARKLATDNLEKGAVQTTPHLFGWLVFNGILNDADRDQVIAEHEAMGRPLRPFLERMYVRAVEHRLAAATSGGAESAC